MTILERIISDKRIEIAHKKALISRSRLENEPLFDHCPISIKKRFTDKPGIIAEHKRRSPSKAVINQNHSVVDIVKGYELAGAAAISVLTDGKYFGGSLDDLVLARASCSLPLLRKDFIIDPYQIIEARAFGADAILLIAAALSAKEIASLASEAKALQLEVLLEVHSEDELEQALSLHPPIDMLGVNNRNLKTFEVSLDISKELASKIPDCFVKISESGISQVDAIKSLQAYGYQGFLIGEYFMKDENPKAIACDFVQELAL